MKGRFSPASFGPGILDNGEKYTVILLALPEDSEHRTSQTSIYAQADPVNGKYGQRCVGGCAPPVRKPILQHRPCARNQRREARHDRKWLRKFLGTLRCRDLLAIICSSLGTGLVFLTTAYIRLCPHLQARITPTVIALQGEMCGPSQCRQVSTQSAATGSIHFA